jgi:hypothetical protein
MGVVDNSRREGPHGIVRISRICKAVALCISKNKNKKRLWPCGHLDTYFLKLEISVGDLV